MKINKGKEASTVYNIIYIPACKRSGCLPNPRITQYVGIKAASKKKYKIKLYYLLKRNKLIKLLDLRL